MARGQLIAESLRVGERFAIRGVRLVGATRVQPPEDRLRADQPRRWTFIGFEMDDDLAPAVADALAGALVRLSESSSGAGIRSCTRRARAAVGLGGLTLLRLSDLDASNRSRRTGWRRSGR